MSYINRRCKNCGVLLCIDPTRKIHECYNCERKMEISHNFKGIKLWLIPKPKALAGSKNGKR